MRLREFFFGAHPVLENGHFPLPNIFYTENKGRVSALELMARFYEALAEKDRPQFLADKYWYLTANFSLRSLLPGSHALYFPKNPQEPIPIILDGIEHNRVFVHGPEALASKLDKRLPIGTIIIEADPVRVLQETLKAIKFSPDLDILIRYDGAREDVLETSLHALAINAMGEGWSADMERKSFFSRKPRLALRLRLWLSDNTMPEDTHILYIPLEYNND